MWQKNNPQCNAENINSSVHLWWHQVVNGLAVLIKCLFGQPLTERAEEPKGKWSRQKCLAKVKQESESWYMHPVPQSKNTLLPCKKKTKKPPNKQTKKATKQNKNKQTKKKPTPKKLFPEPMQRLRFKLYKTQHVSYCKLTTQLFLENQPKSS